MTSEQKAELLFAIEARFEAHRTLIVDLIRIARRSDPAAVDQLQRRAAIIDQDARLGRVNGADYDVALATVVERLRFSALEKASTGA